MRLFDTHCHFETTEAAAIEAILQRAKDNGVERVMAIGGSPELNATAVAAATIRSAKIPSVSCACGYDRDQMGKDLPQIEALPTAENTPKGVCLSAWGEIGLDYHYSPETREAQRELFAGQLEEARRRNLPVAIHTREADEDTLAILREVPSRGIIHCFTGEPDFCRRLLDLGFYISISGIVTFRAADNVRESALVIPDDRILIETDSPYLAPVPMRGTANEPAFIAHTAKFLAELRGCDPEDFADLTFANAERLLGQCPSASA